MKQALLGALERDPSALVRLKALEGLKQFSVMFRLKVALANVLQKEPNDPTVRKHRLSSCWPIAAQTARCSEVLRGSNAERRQANISALSDHSHAGAAEGVGRDRIGRGSVQQYCDRRPEEWRSSGGRPDLMGASYGGAVRSEELRAAHGSCMARSARPLRGDVRLHGRGAGRCNSGEK